jgi:hypothetical protein
MNLKEIYTMALDKLNLKDGDRRTENILKSAINYAYLEIASRDHNAIELEFELDEDSNIVYLPNNFLTLLRVKHSSIGVLDANEYTIINNRLILGTHIPLSGELYLMMILAPDELVNDNDVPEINPKYHMALVYYAMFMYTDDVSYFNLYKDIISELYIEDEMINDSSVDEFVKDVY